MLRNDSECSFTLTEDEERDNAEGRHSLGSRRMSNGKRNAPNSSRRGSEKRVVNPKKEEAPM
jgi:hypothetical protein